MKNRITEHETLENSPDSPVPSLVVHLFVRKSTREKQTAYVRIETTKRKKERKKKTFKGSRVSIQVTGVSRKTED